MCGMVAAGRGQPRRGSRCTSSRFGDKTIATSTIGAAIAFAVVCRLRQVDGASRTRRDRSVVVAVHTSSGQTGGVEMRSQIENFGSKLSSSVFHFFR